MSGGIFTEEHGHYFFDCRNAVWATDDIHRSYHACGLSEVLCDVDFVIETADQMLLVEYKNASVPEALLHATPENRFDPFRKSCFLKLVRKFYDSLHYLRLLGRDKPVHYVLVLEYPGGNAASRKLLRNRLKKALPFALQQKKSLFAGGKELLSSVSVVDIEEWNHDPFFGEYPIKPVGADPDMICDSGI